MAILSTFLTQAHKYDLETASLLRASASSKYKYPEFIATLLTSPYKDDVAIYAAKEIGFFITYKRMIEEPTEEELSILPLLHECLPLLPSYQRNKIILAKFKWPELTDQRLIVLKECLSSLPTQPTNTKLPSRNAFYKLAAECDSSLLPLSDSYLLSELEALPEERRTIVLTQWFENTDFAELADRMFSKLYM